MLTVSFYSFKGGVGRTQSLLGAAVTLARAGLKVAIADMDLEAPGFDRFPALGLDQMTAKGLSDFALERLDGPELSVLDYGYRPEVPGVEDRLFVVPSGTRASELARRVPTFYRPLTDAALVFRVFQARVRAEVSPDVLLIDSRTGLAETAAVCTVELADLVVCLTSLNPQSVEGLADAIVRIRHHPARDRAPAFILCLGPMPDPDTLGYAPIGATGDESIEVVGEKIQTNLLWSRAREVWVRLEAAAFAGGDVDVRKRFPRLRDRDLVHLMPYEPWLPLIGEEAFDDARTERLGMAHRRLAESIARAANKDISVPDLDVWPGTYRALMALKDAIGPT